MLRTDAAALERWHSEWAAEITALRKSPEGQERMYKIKAAILAMGATGPTDHLVSAIADYDTWLASSAGVAAVRLLVRIVEEAG